ncbi:MAG: phosphopantetheine-binding protein, partial [Jiangellaceae bacterium]
SKRLKIQGDRSAIADDVPLRDAGLDSIAILSLVVGLEEEFDLEIPDRDVVVDNFGSVDGVVRYVARRLDR